MRHPALFIGLALALAGPAFGQQQQPSPAPGASAATTTPPAANPVEPEAVAALNRMGTYLHTLKQFTVHADTNIDLVTVDNQKLQFPGTVDYKVRAPDGLFLDVNSPNKHRQLFFDGKTVTIYSPDTKYYASVDAPGNIRDVLGRIEDKYGISLPLADLFLWGTDKAPTSVLTSAMEVGPGRIAGSDCTQYAFRQPGVDWQVWIQDGNQPLPRRLVITTLDDPTQPQYETTLTWNTAVTFADSSFTLAPGKEAIRIGIVERNVAAADSPEATP